MQRRSHLDGIRCFAFLAVFLHHAFGAPMLWAGVDIFFVLSGYLITGILLRSKRRMREERRDYFRTFYLRRFIRIFPPYYLFIGVVFLTTTVAALPSLPVYALYLNNINDAFRWAPTPAGLAPMWSLAVEEQFYLVWPLVVWALSATALERLSVLLLLAAPLCRLLVSVSSVHFWPAYYLLPCRMDLLAAGALLAQAEIRWTPIRFERATRFGLATGVAAAAVFVGCAAAIPTFRTSSNTPLFNTIGYSLVMILATGLIGYLIPRGDGALGRVLSIRPFVFIGVISYTLYLTHEFVLRGVRGLPISLAAGNMLALVITFAVATTSWYLLEMPMQRLKERVAPYRARPSNADASPRSPRNPGLEVTPGS